MDENSFVPTRFKTREVMVGKVGIGGNNPVRIQSMTTSNTRDVHATVEQVIRLADAGCEIVRMTVQGLKEAESCEMIKNILIQKGYETPLVADIHFYPPAAMKVVDYVDKVRINPGNFVDKRAQFKVLEYDDVSYQHELNKIYEGFSPLVLKCKSQNKAIRIGTNHGSLSDRIMNRFGDTPEGMVESALEFARVARMHDFHNLIFSMKASNPKVMIHAYRLLVAQMRALGWDYPLHLGVTEAGEGEDGRIKSAIGIGTLLLEGIGDTIRISLTEDPWHEIDPCKRLLNWTNSFIAKKDRINIAQHSVISSRKISAQPPMHPQGSVVLHLSENDLSQENLLEGLGFSMQFGVLKKGLSSPDFIILDKAPVCENGKKTLSILIKNQFPLISSDANIEKAIDILSIRQRTTRSSYVLKLDSCDDVDSIKEIKPLFILFSPKEKKLYQLRKLYQKLAQLQIDVPVILGFSYSSEKEDLIMQASSECGAALIDGLAEGICLFSNLSFKEKLSFQFALMQASRLRTVKTEFISCPGCGRTLFELQAVSKRIREKTSHLPGVKIAIMGCIVNGPGEMADADFGYVGSRPGKIDLYVGKNCVEKNIEFDEADQRLIDLIKKHGRWVEPENHA